MMFFKCSPCGKLMVPLDLLLHGDTQNSDYILQTPDYIGTPLRDGYHYFVPYERTTVRPTRSPQKRIRPTIFTRARVHLGVDATGAKDHRSTLPEDEI